MMKLPDLNTIRNAVMNLRRDVIRMMRLKFICVAMGILIVVFLIMLTAINMIMQTVSQSQSMQLLQQIAESPRYDFIRNEEEFFPHGSMPHDRSGDLLPESPTETTGTVTDAAMHPGDAAVVLLEDGGWWGSMPDPNWWNNLPHPGGNDQQNDAWQNPGGWSPQPNPGWGAPPDPGWWNHRDDKHDDDDGDDDDDDKDDDNDDTDKQKRRESDGQKSTVPPTEQTAPTAPPETAPPVTAPPPTEPEHPAFAPQTAPQATEPRPETTAAPETAVSANALPVETQPPSTTASTAATTVTETSTVTTAASAAVTSVPATSSPPVPPQPHEPRTDRWKVPISIDHFAILVDQEGGYIGLRNTEDYTDAEAETIMNGILAKQKTEGMYGWLQYCTALKSYGTLIVVTDKTSDQGLLNNLFRATVIIGIFMLLVLLVILIVLSRWITLPVQQAFSRQKQFVSDAGHELKTPLAVLTTNADILQDEIGENKWLTYMQEQIVRMNQLVGDLLRLARMDNARQEYQFTDFDLSMAAAATALPFESTAFEQQKNLELDIQPDVHYCGSEQHIRQLFAIFIDNAIKYSNENGVIKVVLLQRGEHPVIEFYNTGCEISPAETQKIFERFYRGDKARTSSRQSGYGLGLAIARSIMDVHKIKFQVTCEQGRWIRFLLTF